jgi:glycosyltransferase involved in cell wall biosynthesis
MKSLVSCIIPVYNSEATIAETLDSLLEQTYKNWEAIIINDGSTDASESIINFYCEKDSRFKLFSQKNSKQAAARNYGIECSKGDFIAFLDADDILLEDRFVLQVNILEKEERLCIIGGARQNIDLHGNAINIFSHSLDNETLKREIIKFCPFTMSTVMGHREIFLNNRFQDDSTPCEDYNLWLNLSSNEKIYFQNIENVLVKYRVRDSVSWKLYRVLIKVKCSYLYRSGNYLLLPYHFFYIIFSFFYNKLLNKTYTN